jgi:hypothetical protein
MMLRIQGDVTHGLDNHIRRRMQAALGQHGSRIDRVLVSLEDTNGPRGGVDQLCRLIVHLKPRGEVMLHEKGADPYAVVTSVATRAKQVMGRKIARLRSPAMVSFRGRSRRQFDG